MKIVRTCDPYTFAPTIYVVDGDEEVIQVKLEWLQDPKFGQRIVDGRSPVQTDEWAWNELRTSATNDRPEDKDRINTAYDLVIEDCNNRRKKELERESH